MYLRLLATKWMMGLIRLHQILRRNRFNHRYRQQVEVAYTQRANSEVADSGFLP